MSRMCLSSWASPGVRVMCFPIQTLCCSVFQTSRITFSETQRLRCFSLSVWKSPWKGHTFLRSLRYTSKERLIRPRRCHSSYHWRWQEREESTCVLCGWSSWDVFQEVSTRAGLCLQSAGLTVTGKNWCKAKYVSLLEMGLITYLGVYE